MENIHADGAYHSPSNQAFVAKNKAELLLNAIQGPKGRYDLGLDEKGILTVKDLKTDSSVEALKMKNREKWRIKTAGNYRYFTQKEITSCQLRKKIAAIPQGNSKHPQTMWKLAYSNWAITTQMTKPGTQVWSDTKCGQTSDVCG